MKAFANGVKNGAIVGAVGATAVKLCQTYNWVALKLPNSAITFNEHGIQATAVTVVMLLTAAAVTQNSKKNHNTAGVLTGTALALAMTVGSVVTLNPNSESNVTTASAPSVQIP